MSQRQREQQAADGQPPAGPNGELQFQPAAQKTEDKGKTSQGCEICGAAGADLCFGFLFCFVLFI